MLSEKLMRNLWLQCGTSQLVVRLKIGGLVGSKDMCSLLEGMLEKDMLRSSNPKGPVTALFFRTQRSVSASSSASITTFSKRSDIRTWRTEHKNTSCEEFSLKFLDVRGPCRNSRKFDSWIEPGDFMKLGERFPYLPFCEKYSWSFLQISSPGILVKNRLLVGSPQSWKLNEA